MRRSLATSLILLWVWRDGSQTVVVISDWGWGRENSCTYYGQGVMETSVNTFGFPIHDSSSRYTWPEQVGPGSCFSTLTHHQRVTWDLQKDSGSPPWGSHQGFCIFLKCPRRYWSSTMFGSHWLSFWENWSPERLRNLPKEQLVQRCLLIQNYLDGLVYFMPVSSEIVYFFR